MGHERHRKLNGLFVSLCLLLVWAGKLLVFGDLSLQMRWRKTSSKRKIQLPVAVLGPRTSVLKFTILAKLFGSCSYRDGDPVEIEKGKFVVCSRFL